MKKFQKDYNGSTFQKKVIEDNFNSVKESPSKNFNTVKYQKGFNSIKESPNKNSQIQKIKEQKIIQEISSFKY